MNKSTRIGLAALAVALAYPGSAWLLGMRVESRFAEQYQKLEEQGALKVISRDYQRGLFGASETVTLELMPGMQAALLSGFKELAEGAEPSAPLRWTLRSQIQHGPLAGTHFGAARVRSELALEGEAAVAVARLFGKDSPLRADTRYGFWGGGHSTLSSPAVKTSFATAQGEQIELDWQGLALESDFGAGLSHYAVQGEVPGLQLKGGEGLRVRLAGLRIGAEGKRILGDDSELYSGWTEFSLAEASFHAEQTPEKALSLQKLSYRVDMPAQDEFLDLKARLGAEGLSFGGQNYGPAHYDFSLRHVHGPSLQGMQRQLKQLYADPAALGAAQSSPALMLEAMRAPMLDILKQQPVFSIDRLQFRNAQGETTLSGELKLVDAQEADFANPMALIGKISLQLDLSLPEQSALMLATMGTPGLSGQDAEAREAMLRQQLDAMLQQGYLERNGALVKTRVAFSKGGLTLNGKPMGPGAQ